MSDNENPAPEQPAPVPPVEPPPAPEPAAGPVPTKVRWRERAFTLRSVVAVGLAGVILGAGAGVGTALVADDDHGDRPDGPGRHWPADGPGRGGVPGRPGDGFPGRQDAPGQQDQQQDQSEQQPPTS